MGNAVARVNGDAYKILGTLGEGGSAAVYEVLRRSDKRHLALKWVRGVRDAEQLERLQLEIRVHRRLQHAHVLPLVDAEVRDADCDAASVSYASNNSSSSRRRHGRYAPSRSRSIGEDRGAAAKEVLILFPICAHGSLQTMLQDSFQKGIREGLGDEEEVALTRLDLCAWQASRHSPRASVCASSSSCSALYSTCTTVASRTATSSRATCCSHPRIP